MARAQPPRGRVVASPAPANPHPGRAPAADVRLPVCVIQMLPVACNGERVLEALENLPSARLPRLQTLHPTGACVERRQAVQTRNGPMVSKRVTRARVPESQPYDDRSRRTYVTCPSTVERGLLALPCSSHWSTPTSAGGPTPGFHVGWAEGPFLVPPILIATRDRRWGVGNEDIFHLSLKSLPTPPSLPDPPSLQSELLTTANLHLECSQAQCLP